MIKFVTQGAGDNKEWLIVYPRLSIYPRMYSFTEGKVELLRIFLSVLGTSNFAYSHGGWFDCLYNALFPWTPHFLGFHLNIPTWMWGPTCSWGTFSKLPQSAFSSVLPLHQGRTLALHPWIQSAMLMVFVGFLSLNALQSEAYGALQCSPTWWKIFLLIDKELDDAVAEFPQNGRQLDNVEGNQYSSSRPWWYLRRHSSKLRYTWSTEWWALQAEALKFIAYCWNAAIILCYETEHVTWEC